MNVLDLFSGIGGFSLGLERAGMRTVAFCEIDPHCRKILAKHWPGIPIIGDVHAADFPRVDVITGGFPCQDLSESNVRGTGLAGPRSGLWRELLRAIRLVRPLYAIVENVAALLNRGMGTVLGDLAEIGYDAEWHCIPAATIGAPHIRDRVYIVADPAEGERRPLDPACERVAWSDAISQRPESSGRSAAVFEAAWGGDPIVVADTLSRMDDGIRVRMDGFDGCANAVLPQIPEAIGRAIMRASMVSSQDRAGK